MSDVLIFDKPRTFRFTMNALCELEDLTGQSIMTLFPTNLQDASAFKMQNVRMLVYCGLKHEDPGLTVNLAGDLIDRFCMNNEDGLSELIKHMVTSFTKTGVLKTSDKTLGEVKGEVEQIKNSTASKTS